MTHSAEIKFPKPKDLPPGLVYHQFQVEFQKRIETDNTPDIKYYPNKETYQKHYGGYCKYYRNQK